MKRMSYETYAYLRGLLESQEKKLERNYQIACGFIPSEPPKRGQKSGIEKAHEVFRREWRVLAEMKEELHDAAANTYKDHPSQEMRKFWGLTT